MLENLADKANVAVRDLVINHVEATKAHIGKSICCQVGLDQGLYYVDRKISSGKGGEFGAYAEIPTSKIDK